MSRAFPSLGSLRHSLPQFGQASSSTSSIGASCVASSSRSHFHTTAPAAVWPPPPPRNQTRQERQAYRLKKRKFYEERKSFKEPGIPDYVLGHIAQDTQSPIKVTRTEFASNPSDQGILKDTWKDCRLAKILLHPQEVWDQPVPNYDQGEMPKHLVPGLNEDDKRILFKVVPYASSHLAHTAAMFDPNSGILDGLHQEKLNETITAQDKQSEMLYRILDLRNADRPTINAVNRRRIIDEFGGGTDSGGTIVQIALLTMQIRGLNEHMLAHPADIHNRRRIKMLVQQRARMCKYLKRSQPKQYDQTLADCGLDRRTVEGELVFAF